ncbi:hypothetical protein NDN11_09375 [Acinetobacter sp. C26M]|uniref:hypothetical protein n=1 Tax=unclassified Acinetobacter TaxID=196816 RepID=UPI0020373B4B|nr:MULTISPECIES: hypothetical protein [unclassified Acinetobacter]USA44936.1 hypothetical protein NDN11_09325 [Acinetobacter sp. C26M]USA44946.1 hypothetical protein NDN11_09375 [Acinetobacter sp. C26M]USA48439.1 hypothetical protein NDN12_09325 [Acinetobacter sp. C26G]USA48449.1 hypothetical protein NDN12_09375 [Acinetobacter sp. C26G]
MTKNVVVPTVAHKVVRVYPKQGQIERIVTNLERISSNLRIVQSDIDLEDHENLVGRQIEYLRLQIAELKSLYESKA